MRQRSSRTWLYAAALPAVLCLVIGCTKTTPSQPTTTPVKAGDGTKPVPEESPQPETSNTPGSTDPMPETPENPLTQKPDANHPFRLRLETPEFPKGMEWIKSRELTNADLKGKFVILDFWTYCCINCMHILPELKKLEHEFKDELVVIGVHSAKFDAEKDRENILAAMKRYEIEHPVVNDPDHAIWDSFGVRSWPTILMIDPEGLTVWGKSGEFKADEVRRELNRAIPYYRERNLLTAGPLKTSDDDGGDQNTPLRYPGKVLADEKGERLFISDSNHNRIVITNLTGEVQDVIGSGAIGKDDGAYAAASFDHPQGTALAPDGRTLYVADTENHLLRKIDLESKSVSTIAGIGSQARGLMFAGDPKTTALNSPWALWIHGDGLYIAMAGPHQIWKLPLNETEIAPYAGNGREDIVDGPLLPPEPYALGFSSFAQPSGLTSDGEWLYVADSEGSSIRAVPFDPTKEVRTVVGTSHLRGGRLFEFGDVDGPKEEVKLQHALGVTFAGGKLYVADTYNNKIKEINPETGECKSLAGAGEKKPGSTDDPPLFDEPAGISHANGILYIADTNNHLIRTLDLKSGSVGTLNLRGLTPPAKKQAAAIPVRLQPTVPTSLLLAEAGHNESVPAATVKPENAKVTLHVSLRPPQGWKINELAPMSYTVESATEKGPVDRSSLGKHKLDKPTGEFDIILPVTGEGADMISVSMKYYYCETKDDGGNCKFDNVKFQVPLTVSLSGTSGPVKLVHKIP